MAAWQWRAGAAGRALRDPICGGTLLGQGRGQPSSALCLLQLLLLLSGHTTAPGAAGLGSPRVTTVSWAVSSGSWSLKRACASAHPWLLQLGRVLGWAHPDPSALESTAAAGLAKYRTSTSRNHVWDHPLSVLISEVNRFRCFS